MEMQLMKPSMLLLILVMVKTAYTRKNPYFNNTNTLASIWDTPLINNNQQVFNTIHTTATEACASAAYSYVSSLQSCYYIGTTLKTWADARTDCHNSGGWLATITSSAMNSYFYSLYPTSDLWFGLNDITTEGTYVWDYGSSSYRQFNKDEPNNLNNNEDCIHIFASSNTQNWNDNPCTNTYKYICQSLVCPAGSYIDGATMTCAICPDGKYTSTANSWLSCDTCNQGQYSVSGATACSTMRPTCAPTTSFPTSAPVPTLNPTVNPTANPSERPSASPTWKPTMSPTNCPSGTYLDASLNSCLQCPIGKYGAANSNKCDDCPAGTYGDGLGFTTCLPCPSGTVSASGSSSCSANCPLGSILTDLFKCTYCQAGKYLDEINSICSSCSSGKYSLIGSTSCTVCAAGKFSSLGSGSCSPCPSGRYSAMKASSCTDCLAGKYSQNIGSSQCLDCDAGYVSNLGSSVCFQCVPGKYSSMDGMSCMSCPAGKASLTFGATEISQCILCNAGSYAVAGSSQCSLCPLGTYLSESGGMSTANCQCCSSGSYADSLGSSTCKKCPAGTYASLTCNPSDSLCTACPAGKYAIIGSSACSLCPIGKYATSGESSLSGCLSCPPGRYGDVEGLNQCKACGAGKTSTAVGATSIDACQSCAAGTYTVDGSNCISCPQGKYSSLIGASDPGQCILCPPGSYSSGYGASSCSQCPVGKMSQNIGASTPSTCVDCPAGQYSALVGQARCSNCTAGSFSWAGKSACLKCPVGSKSSGASSYCILESPHPYTGPYESPLFNVATVEKYELLFATQTNVLVCDEGCDSIYVLDGQKNQLHKYLLKDRTNPFVVSSTSGIKVSIVTGDNSMDTEYWGYSVKVWPKENIVPTTEPTLSPTTEPTLSPTLFRSKSPVYAPTRSPTILVNTITMGFSIQGISPITIETSLDLQDILMQSIANSLGCDPSLLRFVSAADTSSRRLRLLHDHFDSKSVTSGMSTTISFTITTDRDVAALKNSLVAVISTNTFIDNFNNLVDGTTYEIYKGACTADPSSVTTSTTTVSPPPSSSPKQSKKKSTTPIGAIVGPIIAIITFALAYFAWKRYVNINICNRTQNNRVEPEGSNENVNLGLFSAVFVAYRGNKVASTS